MCTMIDLLTRTLAAKVGVNPNTQTRAEIGELAKQKKVLRKEHWKCMKLLIEPKNYQELSSVAHHIN